MDNSMKQGQGRIMIVLAVTMVMLLGVLFTVMESTSSVRAQGLATFDYQTSFEDEAHQIQWTTVSTSLDATVSRTGSHSLKYVFSRDSLPPSMQITMRPGHLYSLSVWVRTADLQGDAAGARLGLDVFDTAGQWIGGSWSHPTQSDGQWTLLQLPTYTADHSAARASITLYSGGDAGIIWFDDLSITERAPSDVFRARIIHPSYRGLLLPESDPTIQVAIAPGLGVNTAQYATTITLTDLEGTPYNTAQFSGIPETIVAFDATDLPPGDALVSVSVTQSDTTTVINTRTWLVSKLGSQDSRPLSYVDQYGRFWRNGELFFPIGIYTAGTDLSEIIDLAGTPINTIIPYDRPTLDRLDMAHHLGLTVVYTLKDFFYGATYAPSFIQSEADEVPHIVQHVKAFKDHPALLAWYLSDETPRDPRLKAHYDAVVSIDPDHPVYNVDYRTPDPFIFAETTDILGIDIYPIRGLETDAITRVGAVQREVTKLLGPVGQWPVVQAHNLGNYVPEDGVRPPSAHEMRHMAWQYIAEGAKGIFFYSLFDLKQDSSGRSYDELFSNLVSVAEEIAALAPVILSVEEPPSVFVEGSDEVTVMTRRYNNHLYIVGINGADAERHVTLTIPKARGAVSVWKEDRSIDLVNGSLSVLFDPLAIHIYVIPLDAEA